MANALLVHLGVATSDLDRSLRFWCGLLGFEIMERRPGLVITSDGTHNITLIQSRADTPSNPDGERFGVHLGVRVPDLAVALQACLDLGMQITCDDIDRCQPYDPANPPTASFKAMDFDGVVVDFTASKEQWLGVGI